MTAENKGTPSIKIQGLAFLGLVVIFLGVITPSLFRSASPSSTDTPASVSTSSNSDLSGILIRLILFVAVASAVTVAVTRITQARPTKIGNMAILGHVTVDRSIVYLVRASGKKMLVGVDASGVKALTELPVPVRLPDLGEPLPEPVSTPTGAQVYGPITVPTNAYESVTPHAQPRMAAVGATQSPELGPLPPTVPPDFAHELTALLIQRRTQ